MVIKSFVNKGLGNYFYDGPTKGIQSKHAQKLSDIFDRLDASNKVTDMALRLSKAFDTTPELWLNLQQSYDLWYASQKSRDWQRVEAIAV